MLPQQDFESVWRVVDENNDGVIDYGEFMRSFIGEMNETRRAVVRKVYRKLDPRKCGFVNLLDLQKLYRARNHPLVANGNVSESELLRQMKESFAQLCHTDARNISYVEFTEYYEGVSLTVPTDADFINMMRNCWGV
uniref:EF-hand domain-containing protein n=1 Tax=Ciona savignyi TaxID=51511 RepID=H2YU91_CIOSA